MSTILIGVDASERSEDAIAFGRRLADVAGAPVVVANAYPYSALPSRSSNAAYRQALRDDALKTARSMRDALDRLNDDSRLLRAVRTVEVDQRCPTDGSLQDREVGAD